MPQYLVYMKQNKLLLIVLLLIASSCATYAPQYKNPNRTVNFPTDKEIETQFYLIGDAGYSPLGGMSPGLTAAKEAIGDENSENDYALYLGDNIYPEGMPVKGDKERKYAENSLNGQLLAVEEFKGTTYFIPGNHDWYNEHPLKGLAREQKYLIEKTGNPEIFQPMDGCPIKSISVNDAVQILIIDSQWYLEDWNTDPEFNKNCDIKTREKFFIELELEIKKNKNKTILFAMHHPMYTNGTHGGYDALKKHLYPLKKKIPMPILASLAVQARAQGGVSVQDRFNERYSKLMTRLGNIAREHPRLVFASGHEHSLHHIEKDGLVQIQSGSGSKESAGALGQAGLFSYGGHGFAVMTVFKDGSTWVRYFGVAEGKKPILLFEKEIFPPTKKFETKALPNTFKNEITTAIYTNDRINELSFFKTVWGENYKKVYETPITVKVAALDTLFGGLTVVNESSNSDYRSLQLQDAAGTIYRMRSLGKNSLNYKERINNKTGVPLDKEGAPEVLENLARSERDVAFYTATHPYAALAIPKLAESIGVFHSKPSLFYVPKQQKLGRFNESFGDELYFIFLAPNENKVGDTRFKYPDDIETTDDILIKLRTNGKVRVDERNYLKSRLFDMLAGDWDREKNRWKWAVFFNTDGLNVYVPIARNRDDAFSSYEGIILDEANSVFGRTKQSHIYDDDLNDLAWFNKEAIIFDRALLNRSGRDQWKYLAEEIQNQLTDEVIDEAFSAIPKDVQEETLAVIKRHFKARRNNLAAIADRYYDVLAVVQIIEATDKDDIIEVTRQDDGKTTVKMFRSFDEEPNKLLVERIFNSNDTKELWIYGLNGSDSFSVRNEISENARKEKSIFIRLIGGNDTDTYDIKEGKKIKVYEHKTLENNIVEEGGANFKLTDLYNLNMYDYRKQVEISNDISLTIGYNPDDGFRSGAQYSYQKDGFNRNPFTFKHVVSADYYFDTDSFDINYSGEYANVFGERNLSYNLYATSANYTQNYFGYGNETVNLEDIDGFNANRVEIQKINANVALVKNGFFGSFFKTQLAFDSYRVREDINFSLPATTSFEVDDTLIFGSVETIFSYHSLDDASNPSRGLLFDLNPRITTNFSEFSRTFAYLRTRLGFYNSLSNNKKLVLKTNVNGEFNFGNKFEFYQGVSLGGETGLRGYREERFTGKSALVGNADLRYSFDRFNVGIIPLQIGIFGGADLGRVWIPSRLSDKWHNSYGGGLWINGPGGLNGSFNAFTSTEDTRVTFRLGFKF